MRIFTKTHKEYIEKLMERIKEYYGSNLVSVVVFGSYAKGQNKTNSDLDILIVLKECKKEGASVEKNYRNKQRMLIWLRVA